MAKLRMNQAIAKALRDEMTGDPTIVVFGEDVAHAGGPFKTSEGLLEEFGAGRVRDTPISEMGFLGAAVGAAATGLRPVTEIMFIEFLGVALDQLVTEAAKFHYLSGGKVDVPMVVRASVGAGLGFGCQHSQTLETWLLGSPGLKVVSPSGAETAYGLLRSAIRDQGPVAVLEPRTLYGEREEFDPGDQAVLPLGKARLLSEGDDVTVVGLGRTVKTIDEAATGSDWDADVVDLLSLVPWDRETVFESVAKTGRLVLVEEGARSGGWGAHIAAEVAGEAFSSLEAPVLRITSPEVPVPFPSHLEQRFVPGPDYVKSQVDQFLTTGRLPSTWWEQEVSAT